MNFEEKHRLAHEKMARKEQEVEQWVLRARGDPWGTIYRDAVRRLDAIIRKESLELETTVETDTRRRTSVEVLDDETPAQEY